MVYVLRFNAELRIFHGISENLFVPYHLNTLLEHYQKTYQRYYIDVAD